MFRVSPLPFTLLNSPPHNYLLPQTTPTTTQTHPAYPSTVTVTVTVIVTAPATGSIRIRRKRVAPTIPHTTAVANSSSSRGCGCRRSTYSERYYSVHVLRHTQYNKELLIILPCLMPLHWWQKKQLIFIGITIQYKH